MFTRLLRTWPNLALPTQCAVCRAWDTRRLCRTCVARYGGTQPRCTRCALRVPAGTSTCGTCLRDPPPYERTVALTDYAYPWDALVSGLKFRDALDLAPWLADALADAVGKADEVLPQWVLPVPLSDARLRERGYNQAWELARRVARRLGCRSDATLLLRVKDTPPQAGLAREGRAANLRGAFLVEPRRVHELRHCSVALVDDVMTTGATAEAAATALRAAGATRVACWIVARTPPH